MEDPFGRPGRWLALILLLGTVFWLLPLPYFQLDYDGGIYALLGRNWAQGKGFTLGDYPNTVYAPLYPAVFALLSLLSLDLETAGLVFSLLGWWATLGIFYLMAREFWGDQSALFAALLLSSSGFVISIFTRFLADVLFIPLLLASLWLTLKLLRLQVVPSPLMGEGQGGGGLPLPLTPSHKGRGNYWQHTPIVIAWVLVCVALTLTKTEGAYFFFLQVIFLGVFAPQPLSKRFKILILAVLLFLAGLFPYLHFMKEATGRYQLSRKLSINLAMTRRSHAEDWQVYDRTNFALNPDQKTVPLYNGPDKNPWITIKDNFPQLMRNYITNLKSASKTLAGALHLAGFILLGFFIYSLRRQVGARGTCPPLPKGTRSVPLLGVTLLVGAAHLFFLYERRVLVQYFVLIILLLGGGMSYIYNLSREKYQQRKIWAWAPVVILLLIWVGVSQGQFLRRAARVDPLEDFQQQKAAGFLLKRSVLEINKEKIVALKPTASFYAGADFLHLPYVENIDELYQYMLNNQSEILVISPREIGEKRPALSVLFLGKGKGLWQLLAAVEGKEGRGVYIFQISKK